MRMAFFGIPHMGGTHTVYRRLRAGLLDHGTVVEWVGVGPVQAAQAEAAGTDPALAADLPHGRVAAPGSSDERQQAAALLRHLEDGGYDGVFVNVLADRVQTNLVRYLSPRLLRVMIVHTITPGTYAAAAAVRDHVHAAVAVSPRIAADLTVRHGFASRRLRVIANAVDVPPEPFRRAPRDPAQPLRLLFLGRIENASKGVFLLPRIMAALADRHVRLDIAGTGPDEAALRRRCASLGERVRFLGAIPADRVADVMAEHDVLLFPSYFEGLGLSLAEAMASGCVPVASRIAGVTDFVVADGMTGLLHPIGDVAAAARAVRRLENAPALLDRLSAAARADAARRFAPAGMAQGYARLLGDLADHGPAIAAPLALESWRLPRGLRPGLRTYLPAPAKALARRLRERMAAAANAGKPLRPAEDR